MSSQRTFLDLCLAGDAHPEEIDDFIDAWHADSDGGDLHDYLGMSEDEYSLWLRAPDALPCILKARRDREPLTDVVREACKRMRSAAPSNDRLTAARLQTWLKEKDALA